MTPEVEWMSRALSAEKQVAELARTLHEVWKRMDAGPNNPDAWNTVTSLLPAGGERCEKLAEEVTDILRAGLGIIVPIVYGTLDSARLLKLETALRELRNTHWLYVRSCGINPDNELAIKQADAVLRLEVRA